MFFCDKNTVADLEKFLIGFYASNKVNYFADNLISWFFFEAVQKARTMCFIGSKTLIGYRDFNPIKHYCSCFKHYMKCKPL